MKTQSGTNKLAIETWFRPNKNSKKRKNVIENLWHPVIQSLDKDSIL